MPQTIKKGVNALVAEALDGLPTMSVEDAMALVDDDSYVFVDVREGSEQARGMISGAVKSSRGLLEYPHRPGQPVTQAGTGRRQNLHLLLCIRRQISAGGQGSSRNGHGADCQSDGRLWRMEKGWWADL